MWLFVNNQHCFGYLQITTVNNKNTFGAPYLARDRKSTTKFDYTMLVFTLACSAGVFTGRANGFIYPEERRKWGESRGAGRGALEPK